MYLYLIVAFSILEIIYAVDSKNIVILNNTLGKYGQFNDVKLECLISKRTPVGKRVTFRWKYANGTEVKNDDRHIIDSNSLTIKQPKIDDCMNYACYSPEMPQIKDIIVVEAPTRVKPLAPTESIALVEGDTLKLTCEAQSNPKPSLTWYRKRDKKDETYHELKPETEGLQKRLSFKREKADGLTNDTLIIRDMGYEDQGSYTCKAFNGKSEHNSTLTVRIKDKLAALWPFLGIVLEVAILCAIILIYEKRRAKKNAEMETNTISKKSSNYKSPDHDEEDQKMRHRKS